MKFESATVAIATQGCKVNQYDSQVILESLLSRGWRQIPFDSAAELIVINSCTVTAGSDRDLRKLLRRARRKSPAAKIVVTGCKAQVEPLKTLGLEGVDVVLGHDAKAYLADFLESRGDNWSPVDSDPSRLPDRGIMGWSGRTRPILKIQEGCNLRCAYCIVPVARGKSRSRAARRIVENAEILAAKGSREIVLSGIQLGFYRDPDGEAEDLEALLRMLLDRTEGFRIRLGSLLPRHLSGGLARLFEQRRDRLCPHFHVSLQSGDDGVLESMKRPYRAADYQALMLDLWERMENPCLGTDVIAGFPGEDEKAFARTLELLEGLPMAYGHVFPFSMRPGTAAADLGDTVPRGEKKRRAGILRNLFDSKKEIYLREQIGQRRKLLVERRHAPGWMRGTTENYQQMLVPEGMAPVGSLLDIEVTGVQDGMLRHRSEKGMSHP